MEHPIINQKLVFIGCITITPSSMNTLAKNKQKCTALEMLRNAYLLPRRSFCYGYMQWAHFKIKHISFHMNIERRKHKYELLFQRQKVNYLYQIIMKHV